MCARACPHARVCEKKNVQHTNNEIIISTLLKETYIFEKKDSDEVRKNCGDQRNCGKRLEKEIKIKKRLKECESSKKL